jgi:hypothetical protein
MIFKVWLIKFQALLAFKSSLLSSMTMSHGTGIFKKQRESLSALLIKSDKGYPNSGK